MTTIYTYTTKTLSLLAVFIAVSVQSTLYACAPCGALSDISQTINGTDLELEFTSNAGWDCCYTVQIEIVCQSEEFTGIANYTSAQICFGDGQTSGGTNTESQPYPTTVIDISSFCPGFYKWRAVESGCGIYTPEYTFEVVGASPTPIIPNVTADVTEICAGDSVQLNAAPTGGCGLGTYNYSWTPTAGLDNPNIANPKAGPGTTTTYTCAVTEDGVCSAEQTEDIEITVNALPTATITGGAVICQGDDPATVTFTGSGGTAPYTIEYTINGNPQTALVTTGNSVTLEVPTDTPGGFTYYLTGVEEGSALGCEQDQTGDVLVQVNPAPVVFGGDDIESCEQDPGSIGDITLSGSGAVTYTWDNGVTDGEPFAAPIGQNTYTVTGTDGNGCTDTDEVVVSIYPQPTADATASTVFANAPITIDFTNESQNATDFSWDFGDGQVFGPTGSQDLSHFYATDGNYTVTLTASNGICSSVWTIDLELLAQLIVTPPNVFTPNGDGINDEYIVGVQNAQSFEALILNRWGNEITTLTHLNQGWDGRSNGRELNEGVYFIKYKATDFTGTVHEGHTYFNLVR